MTARATSAATQTSKIRVRVHADVSIAPRDLQAGVGPRDISRPRPGLGDDLQSGAPTTRTVAAEPLERIDGSMLIRPGDPDRVAADEVDVGGLVRIWLA